MRREFNGSEGRDKDLYTYSTPLTTSELSRQILPSRVAFPLVARRVPMAARPNKAVVLGGQLRTPFVIAFSA